MQNIRIHSYWRARERHRGYGSNNLWIDQSGSIFNPVWPEPLNDGSGYEIDLRFA